jgi:uncharacterized membrane protein
MSRLTFILLTAAAVGSALMAGSFFAFSTFVMKGLARLPAADGIRAMQAINSAVVPSAFVATFMGTALVSLPLVVTSFSSSGAERMTMLLGSVFYVVGVFGVTAACNVPRNDALAALDPVNPASAAYWARYLTEWTFWNHVRTVFAVLALVLLVLRLAADARIPQWMR